MYKEVAGFFDGNFNPNPEEGDRVQCIDYQVNTLVAGYIWLPFRFDGKMAYLNWKAEWRVEEFE